MMKGRRSPRPDHHDLSNRITVAEVIVILEAELNHQ